MKKVLLTGASGFIGRHAIKPLLSRGYEVHAVSRRPVQGVPHYSVDLTNPNEIVELISEVKPSHLLHFAWYAVPGKYWTSPENLEWVKSTLDLVKLFAGSGGKRAVLAGSCAEYEWTGYRNTVYGSCKAALQEIIEAYSRQIGLSTAWGRIFYLFGPHEHPDRLIPSAIRSMLSGQVAKLSHGKQIRDFMYVEDVADAFATLLESDIEGPVDIASGIPRTIKEVIDHIATTLNGQLHYGAIASSPSEPATIVGNPSRLSEEIKWRPNSTNESALNKTIAWWSEQ